jgi:PAS domain S-box-containing protein
MEKIVIVEDQEAFAQVVASYLKKMDYEVAGVADSGEGVFKLVAADRPALALLDIQICGDMDGFEVAEELRRRYDLPSIFLTSRSDEKTLNAVRESSAYGYLLKPFRPEELKAAIELALIRYAQEVRWKRMEQSFAAAVHSTSDGVIITDTEGRVQFMNPAAERLTGWLARLVKGETVSSVFQVPSDRGMVERLWRTAFNGDSVRQEIQLGCKGGVEYVDVSLARVEDGVRGPQGVVLVLRDHTEAQRAQSELKQSRAQVRSLTQQLSTPAGPADAAEGRPRGR